MGNRKYGVAMRAYAEYSVSGVNKLRFHKNIPNCQEPKLSHRVCPRCGYYKGKPVVEVEEV